MLGVTKRVCGVRVSHDVNGIAEGCTNGADVFDVLARLDLDLDLAPSPGLDIRNARSRGTVLDSARHRAPALCRALEKTRKCALGFGLGQALEPGRDLDIILDRTLDHSRRLDIPF